MHELFNLFSLSCRKKLRSSDVNNHEISLKENVAYVQVINVQSNEAYETIPAVRLEDDYATIPEFS